MITITKSAADKINQFISDRGHGVGIRFGVRASGCNGLMYTMDFVDTPNDEDVVFTEHGASVFVDPRNLIFIDGTELDHTREGLNEGFVFNNPNQKSACGCNESFTV